MNRVALRVSFTSGGLPMVVAIHVVFIATCVIASYYQVRTVPSLQRHALETSIWSTALAFAGVTLALLAIWVAVAAAFGHGAPRTLRAAVRRRASYAALTPVLAAAGYLIYLVVRLTKGEAFIAGLMPAMAGVFSGFLIWLTGEWLIRHLRGTWLPDQFTRERDRDWVRGISHARVVYGLLLFFVAGDLMFLEVLIWPELDVPPAVRGTGASIALFGPAMLCLGLALSIWLFNRPKLLVPPAFRDDPGALPRIFRSVDRFMP
jgi:hypothetical protein